MTWDEEVQTYSQDWDDSPEDDGSEHDLSAGDWAEIGHCDGYRCYGHNPPQDADLCRSYQGGYEQGKRDRAEEGAESGTPVEVDWSDIPY